MQVYLEQCPDYTEAGIDAALERWSGLFSSRIHRGQTVVLKPNWLSHRHKLDPDEWVSVITNPHVITGVLKRVLACLDGEGRVVITDGPQTDSSWASIMSRFDPERWVRMGRAAHVDVQVMDLRDHEWISRGDVKVSQRRLPGDPRGSTVCDLGQASEFVGHVRSSRGYYGADYDRDETNAAHSDGRHKYKVSRTVTEADVFINLPKLKTHKKAGITCSLKNLVGINTYKNWLPHHTEGTAAEGGDQFPGDSARTRLEGSLTDRFKAVLIRRPALGQWMIPVKWVGRKVFGETRETVRSGNWYGNDTIWRMVLDLNKVLLYSNPDGVLRRDDPGQFKPYLSIVDGIVAGEGNGPEAPTPRRAGVLLGGTNPVAVDMLCARMMGFDWEKIPILKNAFAIDRYRLTDFDWDDLVVSSSDPRYRRKVSDIPVEDTFQFRAHFGWTGHVELPRSQVA